jgi:hypothetical protein
MYLKFHTMRYVCASLVHSNWPFSPFHWVRLKRKKSMCAVQEHFLRLEKEEAGLYSEDPNVQLQFSCKEIFCISFFQTSGKAK